MPQIKSSIKRVKTSEKSHLRNISYKSKIKSSIKRFNLALSEKNKEDINKYFLDSVSILDKSVSKGILLKNTASRKKSALNKKLNAMLTSSETDEKLTPDVPKKTEKAQEKPAAPKEKTKTTKTAKTKEKPIVKKAAKTVKKSAAKKTETKKAKK